ncbi:MAG: hypothetical protein OEL85_07560, partial [Desulfobulbaceae bacterium]|nr:hypothetical protein [Desulfobulbaceae bacterium]
AQPQVCARPVRVFFLNIAIYKYPHLICLDESRVIYKSYGSQMINREKLYSILWEYASFKKSK